MRASSHKITRRVSARGGAWMPQTFSNAHAAEQLLAGIPRVPRANCTLKRGAAQGRRAIRVDLPSDVGARLRQQVADHHRCPAGDRRSTVRNARRVRRGDDHLIFRQAQTVAHDLRQNRRRALAHVRLRGERRDPAVGQSLDPDFRSEICFAGARETGSGFRGTSPAPYP